VIIGAKRLDQLEDNLAAIDVSWTDAELERVGAATAPPSLYPHWMLQFMRRV
jgi:aryl-alcohol dehydrogenase-like predicted oxidoreductase